MSTESGDNDNNPAQGNLKKTYCPYRDEELKHLVANINPDIAEVMWIYANILDPYGILGIEAEQVGREYFVEAAPGKWVLFDELPGWMRDALWKRDEAKLAFPAGLSDATPTGN